MVRLPGEGGQFIALYETVSPDPSVLEFTADLKWVATFLLRHAGLREAGSLRPEDLQPENQGHAGGAPRRHRAERHGETAPHH